jgi:hypothetical protein
LQQRPEVRAHPPNTWRRALVARTLLVAVPLAAFLAGCGASSPPSAQTLLSETFQSHKSIESGRLELSLALSPAVSAGSPSSSGTFALQVRGPFQSVGPARLPRFELQLSLRGALTLQAGATSTAGKLFIELAGQQFLAPASTVAALQRGYAQAGGASSPAQARSPLAALGLDPRRWLVHPQLAPGATVGGVKTVHIRAALNASRFLADAQRLSETGGALGLAAAGRGALLAPAWLSALSSGSVRSGRVEVYAGARDHLLRRLSLSAILAPSSQTHAARGALGGARLTFALQLTGLNQSQAISAPSNPQPIARLIAALERLGVLRSG